MPTNTLYIPSAYSPQAMLPRFDENAFEVVSLSQMLTAVANAVSAIGSGANFRINQSTGQFQLLNSTTGLYNTVNSSGANGSQALVFGNGVS